MKNIYCKYSFFTMQVFLKNKKTVYFKNSVASVQKNRRMSVQGKPYYDVLKAKPALGSVTNKLK